MPFPASISEGCRAAMLVCLQSAPLTAGPVPVERMFRAREDAFSRDEENALNIKGQDESTTGIGDAMDKNEQVIDLDIHVRAAQDEVWETKADAIAVEAHARIMAYAGWPAGFARIRKIGARFGGAERAERTPGMLTVRYQIWFGTSSKALDKTPLNP